MHYRAAGCSYCRNTGYRASHSVQEVMMIDGVMHEMINETPLS
ncbi:MAG: hypothetical protein R2874_09215 [Desulfobacterales bacterium]